MVFAVIAYKAWQAYPQITVSTIVTIIKGILILTLFVGNYMGGTLIYRHHIGINLNGTEHGNTIS